jgi:hypothetical protein
VTNPYTVTAFARYFVNANSKEEAKDIVYEALLGNDNQNILGNGEIYESTMFAQDGITHSIEHGE